MKLKQQLFRGVAIIALLLVYKLTVLVTFLKKLRFIRSTSPAGSIMVIGTFHNPNWFQAHIVPLARAEIGKVILVCDAPVYPVGNLTYVCPPAWANRLLTRAVAKLAWGFLYACRKRQDLFMGYHIFPGAVSALVLGSIFGKPACYQVTSGPLELSGGGWGAENRLLAALGRPSKLVERAVFSTVNKFQMVVVRGNSAKKYIQDIGYNGKLEIITGSIDLSLPWSGREKRDIDLVFVGRIAKLKNPRIFVDAVRNISVINPGVTAVMIGDGPELPDLINYSRRLGIEENIRFPGQRHDVLDWLARSKLFLLTSSSEGLSIAMIEAMACGVVPIVSDVGDLKDLVKHGKNGYLVKLEETEKFTTHAGDLLRDHDKWQRLSQQARADALNHSGIDAITKKWRAALNTLTAASLTAEEMTPD